MLAHLLRSLKLLTPVLATAACAAADIDDAVNDDIDNGEDNGEIAQPPTNTKKKEAVSYSACCDGTRIYFFDGPQYYRYRLDNPGVEPGYPSSIIDYWPGWPESWASGIEAGVQWSDETIYFFRGLDYIRYDMVTDTVPPGYPMPIVGNWRGWPSGGRMSMPRPATVTTENLHVQR